MTEPDEAHRAWDECATARFEDEMNGNPLDLPQGMPNIVDFKDGYRAGAAASEARIKVLKAEVRELKETLIATVMQGTVRQIPITNEIKFSAPIRAEMKEADQ